MYDHLRNLTHAAMGLMLGFITVTAWGSENQLPQTKSTAVQSEATTPTQALVEPTQNTAEAPYRYFMTSRPLFAVGEIVAIDQEASSVTLRIDRSRSAYPNLFGIRAKKQGVFEQMLEQEFPEFRAYKLTSNTFYWNASIDRPVRQASAIDGEIPHDPSLLTVDSFHVGDWVGALHRTVSDPDRPPSLLNFCRLDPERIKYQLDYNPIGGKVKTTSVETVLDDGRTSVTSIKTTIEKY